MGNLKLICIFLFSIACAFEKIQAVSANDIPIIPCAINRSDLRRGELALCSMVHNEADYLREWIEFHRLVGVSHFYLYNNNSKDHFWTVLKPYVDKGIVELFDVPYDTTQLTDKGATHFFLQSCCYNHAINLARGFNYWLAIIDSDEFITPVKADDLPTVLRQYQYAAGVVVYWQMYGTSNVWSLAPGELMIEKLVNKFPENAEPNFLFKSIVQPPYAVCQGPHSCDYYNGAFAVAPNHQKFSHNPGFTTPPIDEIRINHYSFRTEHFYQTVKKARRKAWGDNHEGEFEEWLRKESNSVYDPIMERFVPKLKKRLFENAG